MARPARTKVEAMPSQSISSFTRVTKSQAAQNNSAKKAVVSEPVSLRKRKATSLDQDEQHDTLKRRNVTFAPSSDDEEAATSAIQSKRVCRRQDSASSPASTRATRAATKGKPTARVPSSVTATIHKPSESTIIAKSNRQSKSVQTKIDFSRNARKNASTAPAATGSSTSSFPPHLTDLMGLHKAFLSTVALQFVHHGDSVPLDVQSIVPHISRAWGKRQVTIEDIRRCIAIQTSTELKSVSPFIVSDYGRGKVCVELRQGVRAASINEEQLCKQFEDNLRGLCAENAMNEMSDVDISLDSLSLADLPQADITNMGSSIKMHPAFAKGQRALADLKSDLTARQQEKDIKQQAPSDPLVNSNGTKMSLLDRIRYKQLARAGEPLPPSGPELQRRAALNRVVDVAATISMLSLSSSLSLPRQAFTMAAITEKLKDSLRVPLSKEEGMACIRLIATEIAPEWLRIVTVGGRENVVVQRNSQPVDRVICERVQKLLS
ncbi:hypothetical protein HJFPF1_01890 [Paramyrothecium foliicola]|nr:hypothetical protein HJFPF1_01890 [Paramyrothecium foliicola]